jgi:hypothetical protein
LGGVGGGAQAAVRNETDKAGLVHQLKDEIGIVGREPAEDQSFCLEQVHPQS